MTKRKIPSSQGPICDDYSFFQLRHEVRVSADSYRDWRCGASDSSASSLGRWPSFAQILLQATCINELISMTLLNIKGKLLDQLQIQRIVGDGGRGWLQLEETGLEVIMQVVQDVFGLAFALVCKELQGLVSWNFDGLHVLASFLISGDDKVLFIEFYADYHVNFVYFLDSHQLKIVLTTRFAPIKTAPGHIFPRKCPPPLSLRGVPQYKGKIGNIFDDFLLFLPILFEFAGIIIRFLLLQPFQQFGVFTINVLYLFLAEWVIETFVHPLILRILTMPLVDCMSNPLQKISVFSLNFGNFVLHEAMLLLVIEGGLTRRPLPSSRIGSYLPNPVQMLLEIALIFSPQDDLLSSPQGSLHQLQQQLYVDLIITNLESARGCI